MDRPLYLYQCSQCDKIFGVSRSGLKMAFCKGTDETPHPTEFIIPTKEETNG